MTRIQNPLGGRSTEEWIGSSPDAKVPDRIRDRIYLRANGRCGLSGRIIKVGDVWDLDHITPLSMGGEHREGNLQPVLQERHREKTAEEAGPRAKADRVRRKHLGTWPKSKSRIPSRPFRKTRE